MNSFSNIQSSGSSNISTSNGLLSHFAIIRYIIPSWNDVLFYIVNMLEAIYISNHLSAFVTSKSNTNCLLLCYQGKFQNH